jgi:hypothetical protein
MRVTRVGARRTFAAVLLHLALRAFPAIAAGMPYDVFDRSPHEHLEIAGGHVDVAFAPSDPAFPKRRALEWISSAARAVATYYGRFPVARVRVLVIPLDGNRVGHGTTFGYGGAAIRVGLGRDTPASVLANDWVMTHEMVHLAIPEMGEDHEWLTEGIPTYVEPLGRAQAGQIRPEKVWADLVWGLPKGLPAAGDRGLDHTPTWGRTYWGGALFCLLADIEIRERTAGRKGLQDALRAVVAAGGDVEQHWPIERVLAVGDRATEVHVLREMYDHMKADPAPVDLDELWRKLGVRGAGHTLTLDDSAPLAAVRRAIVAGPGATP